MGRKGGTKKGANYLFEYVRHAEDLFARRDRQTSVDIFRPGDIACCQGSLEKTFFQNLVQRGSSLARQMHVPDKLAEPYRFCIVNKHIKDDVYEVFLLSTFGRARNASELSFLAKEYAVPLGATQLEGTIPALKTTPPTFGVETASFAFALPSVRTVFAANRKGSVQLVPGELHRLNDFSKSRLKDFPPDQVRLHKYQTFINVIRGGSLSELDAVDEFTPIPKRRKIKSSEGEVTDPVFSTPESPPITINPMKPPRLYKPIRSNIYWLLKFSESDLMNHSTFLNTRSWRPFYQRKPIPLPYYAPCLRISLRIIKQLIQ